MEQKPVDLLVVGGVAAGASTAARARRLSEAASIMIIERGHDVSFANCGMPYFIGGEITDRSEMALHTPESLANLLNIEVFTRTEAVAIDTANHTLRVRDLADGTQRDIAYRKLVLAPGAAPIRPPLPGIDDQRVFTIRSLQDMDRIAARAAIAKECVIVGAGFIGLEMAEQLARLGKHVTVVELLDQVMPPMDAEMVSPVQSALAAHGIGLILGDSLTTFEDGRAVLKSGRSIPAELLLMSIGVRPESALATAAGIATNARGAIVVDDFMRTSAADVYAAGDVVESRDRLTGEPMTLPLAGPANRQGRLIADHIFAPDQAQPYPGHVGTAIVRVCGITAAMTDWTEKRLKQAGRDCKTVTITADHHAGYYPGAEPITLKLIWDPANGKLLGAQAVGPKGVDKRIDVIATAIIGGMTVDDLCHLELCYAPPFGSARDVTNIAGFAAQNVQRGLVETVQHLPEGSAVLDVRSPAMQKTFPIAGATHIPLTELRRRIGELDRSHPWVTVCNIGKTSYFAARILAQNGLEVRSYTGGVRALRMRGK